MIKKVAIVALGIVAACTALSFTRVSSYSCTAWKGFCNTANHQVPVEFEIARLKHEVSQLVPDMKKNLSSIAQEMAAVERLRDEITNLRADLDKRKASMDDLSKSLQGGETSSVSNGRQYTRGEMAVKLQRDLDGCKRTDVELAAKEKMLAAKEKALESAHKQLASIREQKSDLEVQIAQLEAELKDVRVSQTKSKFSLDSSRLSDIKRSLADLRGRIRSEAIENQLENQYGDLGSPVADKPVPAGDVAKNVREYLEGTQSVNQK